MTLSISNQPSPWHRTTSHMPKRASLLSDATIDPFPQRVTRSASLLEHHIVRGPLDQPDLDNNGRRSTVAYLPNRLDSPTPPYRASALLPHPSIEDRYESSGRKRNASDMSEKEEQDSSSPTSSGQPAEANSGYCLCQPEPKIPRPRNAFILYRQHQQAAVVRKYPGLPNPEISKIIGEQWSKLPEDQKNRWKALAEEEKARHAQQYPDYRYQPRRNGRYSAGSSGQPGGQSSNGNKVDSQGNCLKCGGKTMNPPATPHAVYTPQATRSQDRDRLVSPPHGSSPYDPRDPRNIMPPSYHPRDPRHDPRQDSRYHPGYRPSISGPPAPSSAVEARGHDLKRRRFDGSGIFIPTPEYRDERGYAYSPRGPPPYHHAEMLPHAMHSPRSALVSPPRVLYPPPQMASQPPPKLQAIRPPQQPGRDPDLKLPPLTTPGSPPKNSGPISRPVDKPAQTQKSGLEAMIMSIPVLNKIKILSTVSPSLPSPHPTSPAFSTRGAVVAIEGGDSTTVWSMTNSLMSQLEKDGKFVVKVFMGPDAVEMFGGPRDLVTGKKSLRGPLTTADVLRLVEEWHKVSDAMKKFITTRPGAVDDAMDSVVDTQVMEVDSREDFQGCRPTTPIKANSAEERKTSDVTMSDVPTLMLKSTNTPDRVTFDLPPEADKGSIQEEDKDNTTSPSIDVSPKTLSRTSDLSIATPPITRSASRSEVEPTSVPMPPPPTPSKLDTLPPPSPSKPSTSSASKASLAIPTSSRASLSSAGPIPIALIPQYQLTTTNHASINTQISDSYSPGSHWQWVAALWRGAIGSDVTIAIRPANSIPADDPAASEPPLSDERIPGHAGVPRERTGSVMMAAVTGRNQPTISPKVPIAGPGVEVRLLDYRAVVVRTMPVVKKYDGDSSEPHGKALAQQMDEERKAEEFWEKAKRRVGFEVAEFLRR